MVDILPPQSRACCTLIQINQSHKVWHTVNKVSGQYIFTGWSLEMEV